MTKQKIEEFKKWCETNTATFEDIGDGEEDNVVWSELSFYDELIKKVEELLNENNTKRTNTKTL